MDISESLSPRARPKGGEGVLLHPGLSKPRKSSLSLEGGLALALIIATFAAAAFWVGSLLVG